MDFTLSQPVLETEKFLCCCQNKSPAQVEIMLSLFCFCCLAYRKDLIVVIKDETSGDFQKLLVELCKVSLLSSHLQFLLPCVPYFSLSMSAFVKSL